MNDENPTTLLQAHKQGDAGAAERLAERAVRIALRTALGMLHDRDDARDIAQDTAIEVLRGAKNIRQPQTLDAWIHRIAVRHTMRLIRRHRTRTSREVALADLPELFEPHAGSSPYDEASRRELAAALNDAISLLPPRQRMALVLRYVHDLSHEQVAAAMGIRPGTASALISRATAALPTMDALDHLANDDAGEKR